MSAKYDKYIHNPPHMRLSMKSDKSIVFDGLMIGHQQLGYDFTIGHQFVRKPFKGDTPSKHQDIGINFLLLVETDRILPIQ